MEIIQIGESEAKMIAPLAALFQVFPALQQKKAILTPVISCAGWTGLLCGWNLFSYMKHTAEKEQLPHYLKRLKRSPHHLERLLCIITCTPITTR